MMFAAIENMGSAYGFKGDNTQNKAIVKRKGTAATRYEAEKERLYQARKALAAAAEFDPSQDSSIGDFVVSTRMFMDKRKDRWRYGIAGSLKSLLKRVAFESDNGRMTFDTLVFIGHGNTGLMTVGMGCTPLKRLEEVRGGRHQQTLEGLNMDQRMINVQNTESWGALFTEHRECFAPRRNDRTFHIVFAGCSTGNKSKRSLMHLTHVVAESLSVIFECTVNAYGTDNEIVNDDILEILGNMETIISSAAGVSGSYPLNSGVNLDWVKRG